MSRMTAVVHRRQGESYILVSKDTEVHVLVKDLEMYKLGDCIDLELIDGKWEIAPGMKEREDVVSALGQIVEDEFHMQTMVDVAYDSFHDLWKGFSPILGNILVDVSFPLMSQLKLQEVWQADCLVRRLLGPIDTPHMGIVKWAVTEVNFVPKPDAEKNKKDVENTTVEELANPIPQGEKAGIVIGTSEDHGDVTTAFVFIRRSDVARDTILKIFNAGGVHTGDWVAFACTDDVSDKFEIHKFRVIEALIPARRIRSTVMLKLKHIDVPATILNTKIYFHPDLGEISNANQILQPGKDLTAIVEKKLPTEDDPCHWIVTAHLVFPIPVGDPKYANSLLVAYSDAVGPKVYHVSKELLVCRSSYLAEELSKDSPDGKYPVYGEPKAVGHVLEILIHSALSDVTFLEHDAPLLEFWHGLDNLMDVLDYWDIIYLAKFVVEKVLLYHCEERQCCSCVKRAAYAHVNGCPYPNRVNWNGATVAMWAKDYLDELKKAFPEDAARLQSFVDSEPP